MLRQRVLLSWRFNIRKMSTSSSSSSHIRIIKRHWMLRTQNNNEKLKEKNWDAKQLKTFLRGQMRRKRNEWEWMKKMQQDDLGSILKKKICIDDRFEPKELRINHNQSFNNTGQHISIANEPRWIHWRMGQRVNKNNELTNLSCHIFLRIFIQLQLFDARCCCCFFSLPHLLPLA